MERTLQVLDCAVLVVSGTAGVQGHTATLWQLLRRYQVPAVVFVNKMDIGTADHDALLQSLRQELARALHRLFAAAIAASGRTVPL